jgi:alpha-tubulin suppressor-like RCC1 family protein
MGCNIYSSLDWNFVIEYLGNHFQITINSSNDNTGSRDFGGNWILESGNVNLIGKYFTNNINNYQFVLGQNSDSTYVITKDNKLYGCGGSSIFTIMKDTDIAYSSSFIAMNENVSNVSKLFVNSSGNSSYNSFIINSDGALLASGTNTNFQYGTGTTAQTTLYTTVYTPSGGVTCTAVASGFKYTYMLLSDGSVWVTGLNTIGQLGKIGVVNSFTKIYTPSGGITCTAIACGATHGAMIRSDGSLWTTGTRPDSGSVSTAPR